SLRTAEVGNQDGLAVDLDDLANGGDDALDAGRVRDLVVFDGHVEVGAHQHALVPQIEIVERLELGHSPAACCRVGVGARSQGCRAPSNDAPATKYLRVVAG